MRLHSLEVTAFGPFAERQHVDFDALTQAGLFLLHGPTGAGKSSLLDAVCFALYGRVPGARGVGRLRSDHARGDTAPLVTCEFTVSGRRFEVERSPEWQRPKRRGEGTVTERPHVTLREFVDGSWVALSNRADEVGERLGELIGLGADQFTKLVLLPQGDFAAFLRAHADERKALLQKLFGTERFGAVEAWLSEHRLSLQRDLGADLAQTESLVSRAQQALGSPSAPGDTPPALDSIDPQDADAAAALVQEWSVWARRQLGRLDERKVSAEKGFDAARRRHDELAARVALRDQHSVLTQRLAGLQEQEAADAARQARWDAARAAVVLTPLLTRLRELEAERAAAFAAAADAETTLPFEALGLLAATHPADAAPGGETDGSERTGPADEELRARVSRLRADLVALGELAGVEAELIGLGEQQTRFRSDLVIAEQEHQRAEQDLASLTSRQSQALAEHATASGLVAAAPARLEALHRAEEVARAVLTDQRLADDAQRCRDDLRGAIDRHQAAVGRALDLRQRRLAGMAAELAAGLKDGDPCPVCGGLDHLHPAAPGAAAVTDEAERVVEAAQREAEGARRAAEAALAQVEKKRAAAQAISAGRPAAVAKELLARATADAEAAQSAQAQHASLTAELAALDDQLGVARQRRQFAAEQAADARLQLATIGSRIEALQGPIITARGDDESLGARELRLTAQAESLERVLDARRTAAGAQARYDAQVAQASESARAAGFEDVAQAAAAWLDPQAQDVLQAQITQYRDERAATQAQLADPRFAVLSSGGGDLEQAVTNLEKARTAAQDAVREHTLMHRSCADLGIIAQQLRTHAKRTKPARERFAVLDQVAKAAAGGGDNLLRMRLSSYVLAARLEQVAQAASLRLAGMTGGRYTLVHSDGPASRGAKSGLGLAVVDGWAGTQRDPATLSGGETFCTALALALGLADVVQAEAGGATIETLLVDEGFGSLDADTLDEVMDVLDALRSGGRAVGLVSHVADLRDRIPARLEVVKTRTGSHLVA